MNDRAVLSRESREHLSIVTALGFTTQDGLAFDQSARIAQRARKSALHLVHVLGAEPPVAQAHAIMDGMRRYVTDKAQSIDRPAAITVGLHLCWGDVADEIIDLARDVRADFIILGSTKGSVGGGTIGATARRLMASAPCPVIVAGLVPDSIDSLTDDEQDSGHIIASVARSRITHELEGGASGAVAGAVLGAGAGPPGVIAGVILGSVAGAMAGAVLDSESQRRSAHDRELDAPPERAR